MTTKQRGARALLGIATTLATTLCLARTPHEELVRDIFRELVEINTVTATGDTAKAAEAMAARLRAGGIDPADIHVFKPAPRKGNLVAKLRGSGARKPMILMAHLDVVEARREDWTTDPFKLVEQDGHFYGRGTGDDKFMAAAFVANLIRYKQEGYRPERDLILVLATDEEISDRDQVGIRWLLAQQRALIDAEYALNEGGGVGLDKGRPLRVSVQASEKVYANFRLEVRDAGGHSAQPARTSAIYRLADGLAKLGRFDFPLQLNATTREYFRRAADLEEPGIGADMKAVAAQPPDAEAAARLSQVPRFNAQLRTTCTATMLEGGHAENALPQLARALVNCRVMPGVALDEVQKTLVRVLADERIAVTMLDEPSGSPPSPLEPALMATIEKLAAEFWPGAPVIPVMSAGATDGAFLRSAGIPTYGHSGLAGEVTENRAHGRDERILVKSFYQGQDYLYRLVKLLAGG